MTKFTTNKNKKKKKIKSKQKKTYRGKKVGKIILEVGIIVN